MKLLASSQYLASKLKELDERVERVALNGETLTLIGGSKSVDASVHVINFSPASNQTDRRWDFIKTTLSNLSDQPIVLEISDTNTNIILSY